METLERVENGVVQNNEKESLYNFGIKGLVDGVEVKTFLEKTTANEPDPEKQKALLAEFLADQRDYAGFAVNEIDAKYKPFSPESEQEYLMWDDTQAEKLLEQYLSLKKMEEIMPPAKTEQIEPVVDQFAETQKINLADLEATQKIDLAEVAKAEMEQIKPTETKAETRTNAERYSDLVTKAEAKAREYEQKISLTPDEQKRLDEIRADIAYFSEKMKAAIAIEQSKAPIKKIETAPEPVPEPETTPEETRSSAVVREELIQLNKKPAPTEQEPVSTVAVEIAPAPVQPKKRGLWSRLFSSFQLEPEAPAAAAPTPTKADMFFSKNPPPENKLRKVKVDGINDGVRIG